MKNQIGITLEDITTSEISDVEIISTYEANELSVMLKAIDGTQETFNSWGKKVYEKIQEVADDNNILNTNGYYYKTKNQWTNFSEGDGRNFELKATYFINDKSISLSFRKTDDKGQYHFLAYVTGHSPKDYKEITD